MSIGIAGFSTGVMFAKQANAGTLATSGFMLLPAEDTGGLSAGQVYAERNPSYGMRTQASSMHSRDYTMPGGDMANWAVGIDGSSLALLHMLRMFFQNYSIISGTGQIGSHAWEFTPRPQNGDSLSDYDLYTVVNITGLSGNKNEWYRDCMSMAMAGDWSPGNPLTGKQSIQSMAYSHAGTPSGWGSAADDLKVITAPTLCTQVTVDGSTYQLYPSAVKWKWTLNAEDIVGACSDSGRARMTPCHFSGEATLTIPRNSDLYAIVETNGDIAGTIALNLRPDGNYTTGAMGTYTGNIRMYGKFLRSAMPSGPGGDVTDDLVMHVQDVSWLQYSDLGSSAI